MESSPFDFMPYMDMNVGPPLTYITSVIKMESCQSIKLLLYTHFILPYLNRDTQKHLYNSHITLTLMTCTN